MKGTAHAGYKRVLKPVLDTGRSHAVTIGNIPSLEWFQEFQMGNPG